MFMFLDMFSKERFMCASCSWHGLKSKSIFLCSCKLVHVRLRCAMPICLYSEVGGLDILQFKHSGIHLYRFHKMANGDFNHWTWSKKSLVVVLTKGLFVGFGMLKASFAIPIPIQLSVWIIHLPNFCEVCNWS